MTEFSSAAPSALPGRRRVLAGLAGLPTLATAARAQRAYPERPIRLIVPYGPGTSTDTLARQISANIASLLGQPIVIDNRAGGNAIVGTEAVQRSAPDGYTLMFGTTQALCFNPSLYVRLPYDPVRDFAPVAGLVSLPYVLVVPAELPARTLPELVALAKAQPRTLTFGSTGAGTGARMLGEMFAQDAGMDITHVAYQSGVGPLFADLMTNRVSMLFYSYQFVKPHIEARRLRILANTSATRPEWLPNVPTFGELGYQRLTVSTWFAIYAPAGTPEDRIARISNAYRQTLEHPELRAALQADGTNPDYRPPAQLAAFVAAQRERCHSMVQSAGIQPE